MGKITLMIDQHDCSGCHACEVACKQEHGLGVGPRVVRVIEKAPLFVPLFCHHCEDAPCALACPEDAISKDPETGVVLLDPEKCTGCNAVEGKSGAEKQETSPCKVECPARNDVQGYVGLAAKGKYEEAIQLIKKTSPFPSVCGRVCPHPCESKCNRDQIDDPVAIQSIERFLADQDFSSGKPYVPEVKEVRDEKIAVIGSGPAGLAAAYFLAKEGYKVSVFEKLPVAGGMMAVGIPEYRLPKDILSAEIKIIQDMGVEIKTGVTFGKDIGLESLKKDGYKAFFLATGLHQNRLLDAEKKDMDGVLKGIDFLRDVSLGNSVSLGKRVIVIGGGNVAIDVALTSIRKGAKEVSLVCLEQRDEMPAWEHEIQMALEEGVKIVNGFGPNKFLEKKGKFSGIEFKRCLSVFDDQCIFNPQYDPKDLKKMEGETAIIAIGQAADLSFADKQGIPVSSAGSLEADPMTLQTPIEGVFAGGDVYYGPKTVAEAIGSGKEAAVSIARYLKGLDLRAGRDLRDTKLTPITEPQKEKYDPAASAQMPRLEPKKRMTNFNEVHLGFTEDMAVQEAKRCISCGTCCVQACPYRVMQFNHEVTKAVKCDLCVEKRGNDEAPACSLVCPAHCIYWGDPATFPSEADKGIQKSVP
jgi:NADPH-dependent glutamate synthase beta subunit-like oxidoreductase/NAD-dependent dihydropyrimidine dehydrogenase PreA subunit